MRWRLSLLMFLQYAAPGAVIPLFSLRLQELGFTPLEIGVTSATQALSGLLAPLTAGQVADRWFPAERILFLYAFIAAGLLWLLAHLTTPAAVLGASVALWLTLGPSITLGTSLAFAHLPHPERDFGRVRMWGTVGWIVPGLLLGGWFSERAWVAQLRSSLHPGASQPDLADAFRLGSLLALSLSAYALTLPHTPPQRRAGSLLAPVAALKLLRSRNFAVYLGCVLGVCVTIPLYSQVVPLFLQHLGVPRSLLSPTLTIAQSVEVIALGLLPMVLLRLGLRGTMLLGLLSWVAALVVWMVGTPFGLVVASLALNGLCICCFLVAGQVFVNSRATGDIRASVQGLFSFTSGLGLLLGNLLVGGVRQLARGEFRPTFAVGAAIALVLLLVFVTGFRDPEEAR